MITRTLARSVYFIKLGKKDCFWGIPKLSQHSCQWSRGPGNKPVISKDFFDTFSLDRKFDIDVTKLSTIFRALQVSWHPDKFTNKTREEQVFAAEESALINSAYRTLKDPMKRSLYLLDLVGYPLQEGKIDLDPEFLMEIMDINERLADVKTAEQMEGIKADNKAIMDRLRSSITAAFEDQDYAEARRIVARMKYYANISAKVNHFERERGIE